MILETHVVTLPIGASWICWLLQISHKQLVTTNRFRALHPVPASYTVVKVTGLVLGGLVGGVASVM